jgi:NAD(P)-dependent dehydrogenase (short-subunit alcohol dehydrogenase family)
VGRNPETLEKARIELGGDAIAVRADLGRLADIRQCCDSIARQVGRVDVMFANAGISAVSPFEEVSEESWDHIMNVNLKGVYFLIQGLLPRMNRGSAIVVCGSIVALRGYPGGSVYCAAKAALRSLTGVLAHELGARGIRINTLSPGYIDTPIYTRTPGLPRGNLDEMISASIAAAPMKRAGTPDDCAGAVLYLASNEATFITGSEIVVDGGVIGPV